MFKCALVGGLKEESSTNKVFAAAVRGAVRWINLSEAEEAAKDDSCDRSRESEGSMVVTNSSEFDIITILCQYGTVVCSYSTSTSMIQQFKLEL